MRSSTAARFVALVLAAQAFFMRLTTVFLGAFNFSPMGALGIFGGARLKSWQAYALPLSLMVGTDVALSALRNDPEYGVTDPSRIWVYGCYAIYVLIGRFLVGESKNPLRIGTAALLGAAQFFLITNFCEWLRLPYSRDLSGLITCYIAALPFAINTIAGDLIFTPLAFGAHALLSRQANPVADEHYTAV